MRLVRPIPDMTDQDVERFLSNVQRAAGDACWEWQGFIAKSGYGTFHIRGKGGFLTHRVSYALNVGPIPDGLHICHHCDNPCCVRPSHLFPGTAADNARDRDAKGRRVIKAVAGEEHPQASITAEQVRQIRAAVAGGEPQAAVARRLGLSASIVNKIIKGHTWRCVA